MTSASRGTGALLGVAAAGSGLAVSELVSGILHQRVSPLVAVAETIIRLTPGALIEPVISLVGRNDKPLLVVLTIVGLAVVSALTGVLALRSLAAAEGVFVAMGVVLVLSVHARLTASTGTYIPALVGIAVAVVVLAWLTPYAVRSTARDRPADVRDTGRRQFLHYAAGASAAALLLGATGRLLAHGRAALDTARRRLRLPVTAPAEPRGADLGVSGITSWVTDQEDFYRIDTAISIPQILPAEWTLRIHGKVDRELTLTYQDLVDRGITEYWLTLCCVSNEVGGDLISNAWWSGVPIADLLADAGVQSGADAVLSTSDDGWTCGTPLDALTDDRKALLAVAMNGEPLTPEHGFPVRMVVPGLYGYVSATKWVVEMKVTTFAEDMGYWTPLGWSALGPIKIGSRIDTPRKNAAQAGRVTVAGVAWAQHLGIAKVEVQVDQGAWRVAELADTVGPDTWRQWKYDWDATAGDHTLSVRATGTDGTTQTDDQAPPEPDGATGWHTINIKVA